MRLFRASIPRVALYSDIIQALFACYHGRLARRAYLHTFTAAFSRTAVGETGEFIVVKFLAFLWYTNRLCRAYLYARAAALDTGALLLRGGSGLQCGIGDKAGQAQS